MNDRTELERLRRWRLVLGKTDDDDGQGGGEPGTGLSDADAGVDRVLASLYDTQEKRGAGLGKSTPNINRWLGDIRSYFPAPVVRVLQKDALERLGLKQLLLEPELLASVEADVHLVATLISLSKVIPKKTRETARQVVRKVVDDVEKKLKHKLIQAVRGSLNRSMRNRRPKLREIDWDRTIRANLKHYIPEKKTLVPEKLIGFGRRRSAMKDVILCVDQSGSMATSVVYSGILGAVLASLSSLRTRMVAFDTAVVDLTDQLSDPVELLFGTQLGGGTDIARAVAYCQQYVTRPTDTVMFLITDLCEGGNPAELLARVARLVAAGVRLICLLALADSGTPAYDAEMAAQFASRGVPTFGCTPDLFPDLLAAAFNGQDLEAFAAKHELTTARQAI